MGDLIRRFILGVATIAVVGGVIGFDVVRIRDAHTPFGSWLLEIGILAFMVFVIPAPFERFEWFKRGLRAQRPMMWVALAMASVVVRVALGASIPRVDATPACWCSPRCGWSAQRCGP